ncbi:MAG: FAD-dependent oxidoreductase [bacterium]
MKNRVPYLIIGNSAAAIGAIEGIRSIDSKREIVVVSGEREHTYSKPLISYWLAGKVDNSRMDYRPRDFYKKNSVKTILGNLCVLLDPVKKLIITKDKTVIKFEKLLLGTGGVPVFPANLAEKKIKGLFTLSNWEDARKIGSFIIKQKVKDAVVLGGGMIGMKSLEALQKNRIKCSLVELAPHILNPVFDSAASDIAESILNKQGVKTLCGTTINRIVDSNGKLEGVVLENGTEIKCQLLIAAVGVKPNLELVKDLPVKTDRGILVNGFLKTTVKDIYAAGDVVQAREILSGKKMNIPILPNAFRQGWIAGNNMAGKNREYRGCLVKNSINIGGVPTISVGLSSAGKTGEFEILKHENKGKNLYKKLVIRENKIVGALFIGDIERAGIITGLITNGIDISNVRDILLTPDFGLLRLPTGYRKHIVSGAGTEV